MWADTKIRNSFRTSGAGQLTGNGKTSFLIGLRVPISWRTTEKSVIKGRCHLPWQMDLPFKFSKTNATKEFSTMTKKQAISIITKCAKKYQQYLEGNQVVFIYHDENNHSNYTAVKFHSYHFLHFTGVSPRQGLNANGFYRAALNNRLSEHDFSFKNNHTTELKLNVLDTIMNIDTKARMIGNYSGPHLELYTEKVTGTTTACLGLIQGSDCYIPNSVLSEDIRSIVPKPPGKIYAILKKSIQSPLYTQLTYKSPNITITQNHLPKDLLDEIDSSLLCTNRQ